MLLCRYHLQISDTKDPITDYKIKISRGEILHVGFDELLGEGAMSAVYRGIFKDDGREKEVIKLSKILSSRKI